MLSRFAEEIPDALIHVDEAPRRAATSGISRPRRVERDRRQDYVEPGPRRTLGVIIHPTFGRGDVIGQDGRGPDARLTVVFAGNIRKKIVARYAQWEESHVDL